ncbi:MAG: hypothetical protein IJJ47_02000 [Methanosphaera sp.]|nr:hypothetical protein [Methanosphaera sp.]
MMQQNYSQRFQMQIPQEHIYTGLEMMGNFDAEFEKLSKNYTVQNGAKVKNFIKQHENILEFIHELTPLINDYFPNYQKIIEFCEDPEFSDLDFVMIYIESSAYEQDKEILDKFKNEPVYMSKFSKNINGLLCVELW